MNINDLAVGQTVVDTDGRRWQRTATAWRGVYTDGRPTGDVVVDKTMARKNGLRLVATVEAAPVVAPTPPVEPEPPIAARGPRVLAENRVGARIVAGVPFAEYAAQPGQNVSTLKAMLRSPLHYRHALTSHKTTSAMVLGTAAHVATLEPERFGEAFAIWDGGRRAGKDWEQFKADNSERDILTADERDEAQAIAAAVRGCAEAMLYLATGHAEVSMQWRHDGTGRALKGRADWLTTLDGADVVVGLKTTRDARPREFSRQAAQLGYHLQWAYYCDGFRAVTGRTPVMVEIVVESAAPYDVVVYSIPEPVLTRGRDEYRAALERLDECERSGIWPGCAPGEQEFELPSWAYPEDEADIIIDEAV